MIEKITSGLPRDYSHLNAENLAVHYSSEHQSIEELILAICEKDRNVQFGRKTSHLESRYIQQDHHHATSAEKASHMRQMGSIGMGVLGAACQVAAAKFGGQNSPLGLGLSAVGKGTGELGGHYAQRINAHIDGLTHTYAHTKEQLDDLRQGVQAADRSMEQIASVIERINQGRSKIDQVILAGG